MNRRVSRENAFIAFFELSFKPDDLDEIIKFSRVHEDAYKVDEFGENLIALSIKNSDEIEDIISENLKGWKIERLPRVSKTILKLAIAEILYGDKDMDSIVINEAVEISKKFSDDNDYKFINGVLGNVSRQYHPKSSEIE